MINKRIFSSAGLALLTVVGLVAWQARATPTLATLSEPGTAIGISDDTCPTVIVQVGRQISWTNQGREEHVVRAKSVDGQNGFDSGTLQPGDSFAVTLAQPATYQYECSADGSLTGTITVEP
jgi:plastocyanin